MQGTDNRSIILDCALDLFVRRGYEAMGIQELVNKAGVTKPTLYYYFGSKRGLLETLVKEKFTPFMDFLSKAAVYRGDLSLNLQQIIDCYFRFASEESRFYALHLTLWYPIPDNEAYQVMETWNVRQTMLLETLFKKATRDHGNMRNRHALYAATFLNFINGYISMLFQGHIKVNEKTVWQAVQQFSHGIYS